LLDLLDLAQISYRL